MSGSILLARLRSVHEHLQRAGFDHALGGALALAMHAEPRFTSDIDLNVIADPGQPQALLDALPPELLPMPEAADLLRRDGQVRLLWSDPATPLDLFLPQHPTYHALVAARAELYAFPGFEIKVITATDLLVFKTLFGRSKDFVDIESLGEFGAGDVDEAAAWIAELIGADSTQERRLREAWSRGATHR